MVTAGPAVGASLNQEAEIGEAEDLSHLHEAAQPIARLPATERLAYVRAERWIGYTRATEALTKLETLLNGRSGSGCQTCCCSGRPTTASR